MSSVIVTSGMFMSVSLVRGHVPIPSRVELVSEVLDVPFLVGQLFVHLILLLLQLELNFLKFQSVPRKSFNITRVLTVIFLNTKSGLCLRLLQGGFAQLLFVGRIMLPLFGSVQRIHQTLFLNVCLLELFGKVGSVMCALLPKFPGHADLELNLCALLLHLVLQLHLVSQEVVVLDPHLGVEVLEFLLVLFTLV